MKVGMLRNSGELMIKIFDDFSMEDEDGTVISLTEANAIIFANMILKELSANTPKTSEEKQDE